MVIFGRSLTTHSFTWRSVANQVPAASIYRMVRFLVLYSTPVDEAEFDRHYREIHIPLASKLPGLRRYTVSRDPAPVQGESYYLVAELEWDDLTTMWSSLTSAEGAAAAADVATFATGGVRSMAFELEDVL